MLTLQIKEESHTLIQSSPGLSVSGLVVVFLCVSLCVWGDFQLTASPLSELEPEVAAEPEVVAEPEPEPEAEPEPEPEPEAVETEVCT